MDTTRPVAKNFDWGCICTKLCAFSIKYWNFLTNLWLFFNQNGDIFDQFVAFSTTVNLSWTFYSKGGVSISRASPGYRPDYIYFINHCGGTFQRFLASFQIHWCNIA